MPVHQPAAWTKLCFASGRAQLCPGGRLGKGLCLGLGKALTLAVKKERFQNFLLQKYISGKFWLLKNY
jgi:hypothetical protein